ncbi:SIR2-like protein [Breznakibacter xylanolyticus]|uniref:SIR2-like protein n=1 Tax=Breznakibacter xylanolyticus TaxID=990 RepID=A0A2W7MQZ7_9BACT|nr:SIR2 family protein [Breznakibacter xylanolyticus]PZX10370.1 SIR2-like protein [Breznakibacter xylanolyticus]
MGYEEIKKVIESCHLNFLIGSGASTPFLGTLSDIETLLTDLSKKENDDNKKIVDASIKKHYYDVAIKGNSEIDSKNENKKLDTVKIAYSNFISAINIILTKRKTNLVTKQANLFTTNMDLLLDYTLENQKIAFNDGFSGRMNPVYGTENFHNSIRKTSTHYEFQSEIPLFNVFKLHGSVNWKLNNGKITYDYGNTILNKINSLSINSNDFLPVVYASSEKDKGGNNIWKCYTVDELYKNIKTEKITKNDSHSLFLEAYDELQMVNPTKQKFEITTQDVVFYELLRMYSNHLERENSVLFVFGFSFADEHIREITKRVAASNPTLLILIFAYDLKSKESIQREIPTSANVKIIFDAEENMKYSLDTINLHFFTKLANELEGNSKEETFENEEHKTVENE